ncbi:MAG: hypothetical protein P9E24_12070 [Candidatus Competibacter sp.]|nr:hypothetical protein [Candidatus Competibacter sp.]MDG4584675.1 hypothetical protein [Candidatus Competibacter sp.]
MRIRLSTFQIELARPATVGQYAATHALREQTQRTSNHEHLKHRWVLLEAA